MKYLQGRLTMHIRTIENIYQEKLKKLKLRNFQNDFAFGLIQDCCFIHSFMKANQQKYFERLASLWGLFFLQSYSACERLKSLY